MDESSQNFLQSLRKKLFSAQSPEVRVLSLNEIQERVDSEKKSSRASEAIYGENEVISSFYGSGAGRTDLMIMGEETYEDLLHKYGRSVWVYIAVSRVANSCSQIALRVIDKRKKGKPNEEVTTGKGLIDLLSNPNPWQSRKEFIETLCLHLLLTGNAFIEKAEMDAYGRPKELYILNPKYMAVVPDKKNFIKGYKYTINNKVVAFLPNEVIHVKLPDPRGESRMGLSPLAAARMTITADDDARDWNSSYFSNATWPSGIIVSQEPMGEQEFRRAKRELKTNYEGKSKVGKVILLEGGLDWKQVTPNPKDLDFLNLIKFSREEILSLFGVPPSIAGIFQFENSTSRSAGTREQAMSFHSDTCIPLLNRIIQKLNQHVVKLFGENYDLVHDISNIPALRETEDMIKTRAESFKILVEAGFTIGEAKAKLYPDLPPGEYEDQTLAKFGGIAEEPDTPSEPDPEDPPTDPSSE